jgi:hypothetical protein
MDYYIKRQGYFLSGTRDSLYFSPQSGEALTWKLIKHDHSFYLQTSSEGETFYLVFRNGKIFLTLSIDEATAFDRKGEFIPSLFLTPVTNEESSTLFYILFFALGLFLALFVAVIIFFHLFTTRWCIAGRRIHKESSLSSSVSSSMGDCCNSYD